MCVRICVCAYHSSYLRHESAVNELLEAGRCGVPVIDFLEVRSEVVAWRGDEGKEAAVAATKVPLAT